MKFREYDNRTAAELAKASHYNTQVGLSITRRLNDATGVSNYQRVGAKNLVGLYLDRASRFSQYADQLESYTSTI